MRRCHDDFHDEKPLSCSFCNLPPGAVRDFPRHGRHDPLHGFPQAGSQEIQKDIGTIQQALENKLVQEKLKAYGLTSDEVASKISSMTPGQIHMLATASDDVLAGGDSGLGAVIAVLIIIILIIIILRLMNKQILIKMSSLDDPGRADLPALG